MTPIWDSLVIKYSGSVEIAGLAATLWLEDWYHDRGYFSNMNAGLDF